MSCIRYNEWYALYVKSRHEFMTNNELHKKGIESYLPSVSSLRKWKDRKKFVDIPLFPGYLFVFVDPNPEAFLDVLKTRGAVNFVALEPGSPTPLSPEEIESLKIMLESGREVNLYPSFQEGTSVRVKRGSLKGAEGVVRKMESHYVFHVNIDILGRSVGVKFSADDLETI
jgi:transcription antitermination factor NusG